MFYGYSAFENQFCVRLAIFTNIIFVLYNLISVGVE